MRIPFIPLYIALSTLVFSQLATADEITTTGASLKDVSATKVIETGDELSSGDSNTPSTRCMLKPYDEGCKSSKLRASQLALGLDLSIATQGSGGLYNPEADMNAAIAMQQAYAAGLSPAAAPAA